MSCLVIIEQDNGLPNRPSLSTISAAKKISSEIDLLVLNPESIEEITKIDGISTIYTFKNKVQNIYSQSNYYNHNSRNSVNPIHKIKCINKSYYKNRNK